MTSQKNLEYRNFSFIENNNSNFTELNNSIKRKNVLNPQNNLYILCENILKFIKSNILPKYVFKNDGQSRQKRTSNINVDVDWIYNFENNISEEEKIIDVFKDNVFLSLLRKAAIDLIEIKEYLDINNKKIKELNDKFNINQERENFFLNQKTLLLMIMSLLII